MLVLALDTTTRLGSCALSRDGLVIHEQPSDPERSHAEHLPGDLMALLETAQLELDAVDAFAVATGPGSFTGLRVGIATLQGLAFAANKPLIGISGLDALAHASGGPAAAVSVATWIDAWRGEVYAALYDAGGEVEPPTVEHPAAVLERLQQRDRIRFIGNGAGTFAPLIRQVLGDRATLADPVAPLLAGVVAQLADAAIATGQRPSPDEIRPLYVRRMDPDLARDARPRQ